MDQVLKQEMDNLKQEFTEMRGEVTEMYVALLGSSLTKDGGLIARIIQLEKDVAVLEEKTENLKRDKTKSDVYVNILWAAGGVICTGIIGYILSILFKK